MEFVYPPACLLCDCELPSGTDRQSALCTQCVTKLTVSTENPCQRCGARAGPYVDATKNCAVCKDEKFAFNEVVRLGLYHDEMRVACLRAKNPSGGLLAQTLADLLVHIQEARLSNQPFDAVVPVPEHWFKRWTRSQYAAETIARRLSSRLKVRLATGILAKVRWTPKQAKSSPVERRQQQKDAFHVRGSSLKGQSILLVDDILTTGGTAHAAARELKRAGAKRVVVAVIAVSPPRAS